MRVSVSKLGLACGVLLVAAEMGSTAAWAQQLPLQDQMVTRPYRDSLMTMSSDGKAGTGMEVSELKNLVKRVEDQATALEELRKTNEALSRKVDDQAQKITKLERTQTAGGRSDDSQKGDLDKLSRKVDSQKSELDKLSRTVSQMGGSSSSDDRKIDDLRRRIDDVKSSVDDLRRRVK